MEMLPTDYIEKFIAYQCHIINLHQAGDQDEITVFFDMLANTTVDAKGSKSVLSKQ